MNLLKFLAIAHAHCDVPCGIYDPSAAIYSAVSVVRFLDQIADLEQTDTDTQSWGRAVAQMSRLVQQKETHATMVKSEIRVIWGDYFKAEHFESNPELHSLTHGIMQVASACKQHNGRSNGVELLEKVNAFAYIYWQIQNVETRTVLTPYKPHLPVIQPILSEA
ncbi:MAG: superoxide dismutase, Ni [Pseudomonadota bacterium]